MEAPFSNIFWYSFFKLLDISFECFLDISLGLFKILSAILFRIYSAIPLEIYSIISLATFQAKFFGNCFGNSLCSSFHNFIEHSYTSSWNSYGNSWHSIGIVIFQYRFWKLLREFFRKLFAIPCRFSSGYFFGIFFLQICEVICQKISLEICLKATVAIPLDILLQCLWEFFCQFVVKVLWTFFFL